MKLGAVTLAVLGLLLAGGCIGNRGVLTTSTGKESEKPSAAGISVPSSFTPLSELVENPEAYAGHQLQVAGNLRRAPLPLCESKPRLSPSSWVLFDEESEIHVAGLSPMLNNIPSTIAGAVLSGRWSYWEGLVGCGRDAAEQEVWYLETEHVIAPNPIAFVPIIEPSANQIQLGTQQESDPAAEGLFIVATATPFTEGGAGLLPTSESEFQEVVPTATVPGSPTPTNTPESYPAELDGGTAETEMTSTPTGEAVQVTPTATAPSTNTPTPVAPSSTPQIVDRMALEVSSIETGSLGEGEIHRWTHEITSTKSLSVSIASDIELDIAVSIVDPDGLTIADQNNAQNGEPEILSGVSLVKPGTYEILVRSPLGTSGSYAILLSDESSYPYHFQGTLGLNSSRGAHIKEQSDHFWHFSGIAGQAVTISVVPDDDSDLFLNLFGTDGVSLIRFHDETGAGEPEQIVGYLLPATGIYSLRVGEFNFESADYQIFITED